MKRAVLSASSQEAAGVPLAWPWQGERCYVGAKAGCVVGDSSRLYRMEVGESIEVWMSQLRWRGGVKSKKSELKLHEA